MPNHKIQIVGLGMDHGDCPRAITRHIERADVLVGGERLLDPFQTHPATKIPIKGPLANVLKRIQEEREAGRYVVVLADGDPGFFGIGKRITETVGKEHVVIHPNVSVLQTAAARLRRPWDQIRAVSLHGRKEIQELISALVWYDLVGVYTDSHYHPGRIAEALTARMVDAFEMHVFENLGQPNERIQTLGLSQAAHEDFGDLTFVILERVSRPEIPLGLGLEDHLYLHEKGLITKKEVRAVGLAMLDLEPHHIFWDLGAGCGSVGIEGSVLVRDGWVLAIERNPERVRMIRENIRRTGAYGVDPIHGEMPGCLGPLPDPDRIFLGGGMGRDIGVLDEAFRRLKPGGKIVLHLVLLGSLERVRRYLDEKGNAYEMVQVQVARSKSLAGDQRFEALNPVYILKASRPG